MAAVALREYRADDAPRVDALGVEAFGQYAPYYSDWPALKARLGTMSTLAEHGEIIIAEVEARIVGWVAYIGPGKPKSSFYLPQWAVMRMLVVSPSEQGQGIGRLLADECIRRAERDGAEVFALHTSEMMKVALPMYQRMGFTRHADAPTTYGVKYGVYTRKLGPKS
jgi:ribosomal protein S18 acetylase RimI-like enzyme